MEYIFGIFKLGRVKDDLFKVPWEKFLSSTMKIISSRLKCFKSII